jgi:predicted PurR-regulated permease PerM
MCWQLNRFLLGTQMNELKTRKISAQAESNWGSRNHVHTLVLMTATVAGVYVCYLLAAPFFPAFAWALALAILFTPLHRWFESKIKHPNLSTTLCVLVAALIVVVPAIFVAERIISEATRGAESIKVLFDSGEWRRTFEEHPILAPVGHWVERQIDLPGLINNATAWLTGTAASFVQGSMLQLIGLVLTFYIFFYFLRDRNSLLESIRSLSPLSEEDMNRIFAGVSNTVHATLYGTFAVAVVQGALGGLMFWWLGLPAPLLWGIVMALLAVVPVLGAFIIWIPAAIFMVLQGSGGKALVLTLWGTIVVGGIDNLLYPMLVGKQLKMHTVLAFVSLVGGLIVFGPSGLILGPIIFTVTRLLLEIWRRQNTTAATDQAGNTELPKK